AAMRPATGTAVRDRPRCLRREPFIGDLGPDSSPCASVYAPAIGQPTEDEPSPLVKGVSADRVVVTSVCAVRRCDWSHCLEANAFLSQLEGQPNPSAGRAWRPANGLRHQLRRQERTAAAGVLVQATEQCLDVVADGLHAAW